ncbi:MAG: extracellular solute-binding protein [Candidatus Bathyarchaeia archaeon]
MQGSREAEIDRRRYLKILGFTLAAARLGAAGYATWKAKPIDLGSLFTRLPTLVGLFPSTLRGKVTSWEQDASLAEEYVAPRFREAFPRVELNYKSYSWGVRRMKFNVALMFNVGLPSTVLHECRYLLSLMYLQPGKLLDLSDRMKPYLSHFSESDLAILSGGEPGRVYAVPLSETPPCTYYNLEAFQEAGIAAEDLETFQDWVEAGETIVHRKKIAEAFMVMDPASWGMEIIYRVPCWDEDLYPLFDEGFHIELLNDYCRLRFEHRLVQDVSFYSPEYWEAYEAGKSVFYTGYEWWGLSLMEHCPQASGIFRVAPHPRHEPDRRAVAPLKGVYPIPVELSEDDREAAWRYLEFTLCNPDSMVRAWKDAPTEDITGFFMFPAHKEFRRRVLLHRRIPFYGSQEVYRVWDEASTTGEAHHFPPEALKIYFYYGEKAEEALLGNKTARQACRSVQEKALELRSKRLNGTLGIHL